MYRLYLFPGGRRAALTLSYDDGGKQDRKLVGIMNRYGIRGTFHLNTGSLGTESRVSLSEAAELYKGHEVSVHTVNHEFLTELPNEAVIAEILNDRRLLEDAVGYPVRGMSYPYGRLNRRIKDILAACGIVYSRGVVSTNDFGIPEDFLKWQPTCHHNGDLNGLADRLLDMLGGWRREPKLFYVWGHSFEFDRNGNWNLIEEFCAKMGGRDDIWYATNIEIFDYIAARSRLEFSADCRTVHNPSAISVWVDDRGVPVEVHPGETLRQRL